MPCPLSSILFVVRYSFFSQFSSDGPVPCLDIGPEVFCLFLSRCLLLLVSLSPEVVLDLVPPSAFRSRIAYSRIGWCLLMLSGSASPPFSCSSLPSHPSACFRVSHYILHVTVQVICSLVVLFSFVSPSCSSFLCPF